MAATLRTPFTELAPPLSPEEALVEADRCLECGGPYAEAPCVVACPADVDVPGFVGAIARGEAERAAEIVWQENLLGGSCARVCPVEVLCAGACVLLHEGRDPIEIGRLQRYATDAGLAAGLPLRPPASRRRTGRVVVLGAGPAGLTCAGELAARGIEVTVVDERAEPGGLVRFAIAPYRQQREPLPAEAAALERLGVRFRLGTRVDSPQALRELLDGADALFLGVGMGADADVAYPGDELDGVWESLPFIETLKTGAPPAVEGRRVAVLGGGNTAVDVAVESARLGASEVTMIYRRTETEMPAYPHEVEQARAEGVSILFLASPVRFVGEREVRGVECVRMRLAEPDESGRRRPEPVPGSEFLLAADVVVKAIGRRPRSELLSWLEGVELAGGKVVVDGDFRTGNPKVYAAGDACNGGATVVEAVRGAKVAARAIAERLP
ncbi:MAG: FAD-dependent oxidoreductase [Thermoleophilia bacterium]|nr:FAD-dependent oxidoreductase [Thermoleophilia bacterium]